MGVQGVSIEGLVLRREDAAQMELDQSKMEEVLAYCHVPKCI